MNYSYREKKMFVALGFDIELLEGKFSQSPLRSYEFAIRECFLLNRNDEVAQALRRAAKAIFVDVTPYRMTQEFDDLISFEEQP